MAAARCLLLLAASLLMISAAAAADRQDESPPEHLHQVEWWKKTNFYHIYIRSFQDSDGDGEGDLRGVIRRLDYLHEIGVETLLLSPFYSSPQKDAGYDISDYKQVDPRYGSLVDFEELVGGAHSRGLKVVVDFVPNHSSNQHAWFQCSERALLEPDRCGQYRDYYVWSNSTRFEGRLPSNWVSVFGGGSAWQWSEVRREFYLHQFLPEQPDLNFDSEQVRAEFKDIIRFWLGRGVDGLRVDSLSFMFEDLQLTDEPLNSAYSPGPHSDPYDRLIHTQTRQMPQSTTILQEWQQVLKEPELAAASPDERIIITEAYDPIRILLADYGPSPGDVYAQMPFNFELFHLSADNIGLAGQVQRTIEVWLNATQTKHWPRGPGGAPSPWTIWVTGNHDQTRIAERVGVEYQQVFKWLAYLSVGVPVNYYGDEIGVHNLQLHQIPKKTLAEGEPSRLAFRALMAWSADATSGGFSTSNDTWLALNTDYRQLNVDTQRQTNDKSLLKDFKRLQAFRKSHLDLFVFGDLVFFRQMASSSRVFAMARVHPRAGSLLMLVNFDPEQREVVRLAATESLLFRRQVQPPRSGRVLVLNFETDQLCDHQQVQLDQLALEPKQAALIVF